MAITKPDGRQLIQVWVKPPIAAAVDEAAKQHDLTRAQFLRVLFAEAPKLKLKTEVIREAA